METESCNQTILAYEEQLQHVELALASAQSDEEKENLISLRNDIEQLLSLTREKTKNDRFDEEYALFMLEVNKEDETSSQEQEIKSLEGTKCKAPHKHSWGEIVHHNAMICSVMNDKDDVQVKVMFINPTHREMLPCPYYLETDCKFSEEQCRFSHGEIVPFSSLKEYVEPNFADIKIGSNVLAKKADKLWYRATVKRLMEEKCVVRFDSNIKEIEVDMHDILPLDGTSNDCNYSDEEGDSIQNMEDVINKSLLIQPSSSALGDWEKHTKGIGSKLMAKMGYIIGSGLGKNADGRLEPVTAVILPAGKSLDHCMQLRENAGGDKDLFSVERKLKRMQKRQEARNQKAYERERKKVNVFNFLNDTLSGKGGEDVHTSKSKHRQDIKMETSRSLNVASLKIDEDIRRLERDLCKIKDSLKRHTDVTSRINKSLRIKQRMKQDEIAALKAKANNIHHEQGLRNDKKKMTVF